MNNKPRQILVDLIADHGPSLAENPRRVEAFLRDLCGEHKRENFVLVMALKLGVANDLLASNGVPTQLLMPRLAQQLVDSTAIAEEAANWAVESWALALNGNGQVQSPEAQPSGHCPACGEPVSPKAKFCAQCGQRLDAAVPKRVKPAPKPAVSPPPAPKPSPPDPSDVERNRLVALMTDERQPPRERARAGDALAELGDNRPGVGVVPWPGQPALPQMQFCYIPPGPFWVGDDTGDRNEQPCHRVEIPYGYWLARYPVTVAQWQAFVQAGHKPQDADSLRDPQNRPVRSVAWYEAVDYCQWLTGVWRQAGILPADWVVRLPSEAAWEKAARGGEEIPVEAQIITVPHDTIPLPEQGAQIKNPREKRRYPWGDEVEANRLNYGETGVGTTSAVGCFPGGRSPYGCEEMSGNVWEWCSTVYGDDSNEKSQKTGNLTVLFGRKHALFRPKPPFFRRVGDYPFKVRNEWSDEYLKKSGSRVLRGGCWDYDPRLARVSSRNLAHPVNFFDNFGFRLIVAPVL